MLTDNIIERFLASVVTLCLLALFFLWNRYYEKQKERSKNKKSSVGAEDSETTKNNYYK